MEFLTKQQALALANHINAAVADGWTVKLNKTEIGGAIPQHEPCGRHSVLCVIYVGKWISARLQLLLNEDVIELSKPGSAPTEYSPTEFVGSFNPVLLNQESFKSEKENQMINDFLIFHENRRAVLRRFANQ
jgi:hypothetical protein